MVPCRSRNSHITETVRLAVLCCLCNSNLLLWELRKQPGSLLVCFCNPGHLQPPPPDRMDTGPSSRNGNKCGYVINIFNNTLSLEWMIQEFHVVLVKRLWMRINLSVGGELTFFVPLCKIQASGRNSCQFKQKNQIQPTGGSLASKVVFWLLSPCHPTSYSLCRR